VFSNTLFTRNSAVKGGGAVALTEADATFTACTMESNQADYGGGALLEVPDISIDKASINRTAKHTYFNNCQVSCRTMGSAPGARACKLWDKNQGIRVCVCVCVSFSFKNRWDVYLMLTSW
jgi:predicted outer membrane repeat protein